MFDQFFKFEFLLEFQYFNIFDLVKIQKILKNT